MTAGLHEIERRSEITCPQCGHRKLEEMPTDSCLFFYECEGCAALLRPNPGDCCVFCSYGTVPCPPIQARRCCGDCWDIDLTGQARRHVG